MIKKAQIIEVERRHSATESCYSAMRDLIVGGKLDLHERMPTVRSVAQQLGVSRHVVWLAIKQLEEEGLIRRRGRSYIVKSRKPTAKSTATKTIAVLSAECNKPLESIDSGALWAINHGINFRLGELDCNCLRIDPDHLNIYEVNRLIDMRPHGVIAFRESLQRMTSFNVMDELEASGIPLVVYGYEQELMDYDYVKSAHEQGTYNLVKYLADKGCKRLLRYWCFPEGTIPQYPQWLAERDIGYERAIEDFGLEYYPASICSGLPFDTDSKEQFRMKVDYTAGQLARVIANHGNIDAILAMTDSLVYLLAESCKDISKLVKKQIAIAGYDNYWASYSDQLFAPYVPLMVTVDKRNQQIGIEMVDLLIARINNELPDSPEHRLVQPQIVESEGVVPYTLRTQ